MAKALQVILGILITLVPLAAFTGPDLLGSVQQLQQRTTLRQATERYRVVTAAVADGYVPQASCRLLAPDGPGTLYANPRLAADTESDARQPEALLYAMSNSGPYLVALIYEQPDVGQPRPALLGQPFDGPMRLAPGKAPQYTLHVWLWETNPASIFAPWNPRVSC